MGLGCYSRDLGLVMLSVFGSWFDLRCEEYYVAFPNLEFRV